MKKLICTMMVVAMMVSATSALADGRGHRGGRGGGGVSDGAAIAIGVGALILGSAIASSLQQPPAYYVPTQPSMNYYQPQPPPSFIIGTCFPYGAYFPIGVNVVGRGFYPPGASVPPGFCFQ
jgi:hypothetical protein